MEFIYEYGLFLLKAITWVIAIAVILGLVASVAAKQNPKAGKLADGQIEVTKVNDRFEEMHRSLKMAYLDEDAIKKEDKEKKKREKKEKKSGAKTELENKKRVFLVDFDGDMKASSVDQLRQVITAVLMSATEKDEVVIRLESAGGMVHSYGLASSQLDRIRQRNIPLTVCVDKVAASGGYMMACVANKILAAPFAIIGSIGVVAQLPNFHKLLKKNDIDFEMLTAGEYKRTLTMFGENTDKARRKFVDDLEITHQLFKDFVKEQRDIVDIDAVATGEIWFGTKALEHKLIDSISTSDDYITQLADDHDVFAVDYVVKKRLPERLGLSVQAGVEQAITRIADALQVSRFYR